MKVFASTPLMVVTLGAASTVPRLARSTAVRMAAACTALMMVALRVSPVPLVEGLGGTAPAGRTLVSEPLLYHEVLGAMKPSVRLGLLAYCSSDAGLVV